MKFYFGDMKRILAADASASLLLCKTHQIMTRKLREMTRFPEVRVTELKTPVNLKFRLLSDSVDLIRPCFSTERYFVFVPECDLTVDDETSACFEVAKRTRLSATVPWSGCNTFSVTVRASSIGRVAYATTNPTAFDDLLTAYEHPETKELAEKRLREIQHEKLFHLCGGRSLCECLKWCEDTLSEISPTDRAVVVNGVEVRFDN